MNTNIDLLPVFVYGTLRNQPGCGNYGHFLAGATVAEQRGTITGARMYDYGGFPFVKLTGNPDEKVVGEVMTLDPHRYDAILAGLDRLEGYRPNGDGLYDRKVVTVDVDGEDVQALIYVVGDLMDEQVSGLPVIASGDWLDGARFRRR